MGKKYIIELESEPFKQYVGIDEPLYRVKGFNSLVFDEIGLRKLTPYTEPDLEQVRKEAYENGYENGFIAGHLKAEKSEQSFYEDGYQRGLNDAWEAARKIVLPGDVSGIYLADLEEIFDRSSLQDVIKDYSASECIEKIQAYEKRKEEQIQVGDEVINRDKKAVVTEITDRFVRIMYSDGSGYALFSENMAKTGRNFPEIAEVLEKMREESNG